MFAGAIRNTPNGEVEAAKAMGMTRSTALRRIILPSALRRALPPFSNEVILMLQGSAIASAVTLVDLTGAARNVYSRHYAPFEAFIFAGLLYLVVTFVLVGLFRIAENRWLAHLQPRRSASARRKTDRKDCHDLTGRVQRTPARRKPATSSTATTKYLKGVCRSRRTRAM
jgi:arginine/ornithine transport system permease protein